MAVIGVLTEADVADHRRVRLRVDPPDCPLDDAVVGVRPAPLGVFRLGDAEEDHGLDAGLGDLLDAVDRLFDRDALVARHRLDRHALVGRRVDEDGCDQVGRREVGLGDQRANAVGPESAWPVREVHVGALAPRGLLAFVSKRGVRWPSATGGAGGPTRRRAKQCDYSEDSMSIRSRSSASSSDSASSSTRCLKCDSQSPTTTPRCSASYVASRSQ
ncbi:hypothetical protein BN903_50 [Halorubrum sp. AJ67]|nr:hypothetical protein BN903_50 [Halorubrum sp. AJ67]